ncbi:MAG: carbohydrate porin [Nitrospirota bacterium]
MVAMLGVGSPSIAADDDVWKEIEGLKTRLRALEEGSGAAEPFQGEAAGHRPHPLHSLAKTTLDGDITMIGQTTPSVAPGPQSEGTMSVDLFFEHQVSDAGLVLLHLDVAQGQGFQFFPVFVAPNGNPTGSNNDIETFDGQTAIHLAQAYYHHHWFTKRVELTIGQYDPTAFFDTNAYANSERTQFVAPAFGTNPALEFGGTGNFYGFGGVLEIRPVEPLTMILGVMEGDGDYREMFTRPWSIAEVDLDLDAFGREGTYRFFVWANHRHHEPAFSLDPDFRNRGWGFNFDQAVSAHVGIWARFGVQDDRVAFFDRSASVGVQLGGGGIGRPHDAFGVGYGLTMIGDEYQASQAAAGAPQFDANEGYLEAYYRYVLSGDGERIGVAVSPDVQYATNAGGDRSIDPIMVYGVRFQAFF